MQRPRKRKTHTERCMQTTRSVDGRTATTRAVHEPQVGSRGKDTRPYWSPEDAGTGTARVGHCVGMLWLRGRSCSPHEYWSMKKCVLERQASGHGDRLARFLPRQQCAQFGAQSFETHIGREICLLPSIPATGNRRATKTPPIVPPRHLHHVPHCPNQPPACRGRRNALTATCEGQPLSHLYPEGAPTLHSAPPADQVHAIEHPERLPAPPVQHHQQHGQHAHRERCLWRAPGALGQVLGSPDGAIAGELQDQPAAGPHAPAHCARLWHPEGRGCDGQHEVWAGYGCLGRLQTTRLTGCRPQARKGHPAGGRGGRFSQARRPFPARRVADGLGHPVQHERERGHLQPRH
jgi:hypothetical protein